MHSRALNMLQVMICARVAQSVVYGLLAYKETGEAYFGNSQATGWKAARRIFSQRKNFTHVFGKAFRISA